MNVHQQKIINEWVNTSNYVYNKTLEKVKSGLAPNWMDLRDLLVISKTKKTSNEYISFDEKIKVLKQKYKDTNNIELKEAINKMQQDRRDVVKKIKYTKNNTINDWELNTPKEVRTCAVKEVCSAYKTGFTLLKTGKIKHFNLEYRKKIKNNKCVNIPKSFISLENINNNTYVKMAPSFLNDKKDNNNNSLFLIGKKTIKKNKNIKIDHDCKIIKQKNKWWLLIPITVKINDKVKPVNYCGVDPGIRTFMTTFGNSDSNEYNYRKNLLDKLNREIILIKNKTGRNNRLRKKSLTKREEKKINIVNELHWKTANDLIKKNDVIFYGDIKSHDIVGKSNNKNLKRSFNDMKFYKFKERLLYKASIQSKLVICVNESYTSKTCSFCGNIYNPGCSKIYDCVNCHKKIDRDINAAKNILMKGILN
jgi:putative transposase